MLNSFSIVIVIFVPEIVILFEYTDYQSSLFRKIR